MIDLDAVRAQQREINMVSDEVLALKRKLLQYHDVLDEAWKSYEVKGMDRAIEDVENRLNRISRELDEIGHDVMAVGEEIRAEEEAEEARRLAEEEAAREAERLEEEKKKAVSGGKQWQRLI